MMCERLQPRSVQGCHRARANQGQALRVAAKDAASLDRPCARRLRDLAVGTEECSRRGSNQRMDPKRNKKTGYFKPLVLSQFQAAVDRQFDAFVTKPDMDLAGTVELREFG